MKNKGLFVVFEGCDGSGKTTLINNIVKRLRQEKISVCQTREPGGCLVSEKIRDIIVNNEIDAKTECLLFAAARNEHLLNTIIPALNEGKIVLCDRFVYSSIAYQKYARNLDDFVINVNDWILNKITPDIIIYLDLPPAIGLQRIYNNRHVEVNRLDQESLTFHQKVYDAYQLIFKNNHLVKTIDASKQPEIVFNEAYNIIKTTLGQNNE